MQNVFTVQRPEILEPRRRQLGVAHRVLDVLVPHPGLDRPRIVASVSQSVAASVPEHMGVTGSQARPSPRHSMRQGADTARRQLASAARQAYRAAARTSFGQRRSRRSRQRR
jgi:hypothetical protein